ncbi:hypothetical protein [Burkholderia gladioli]|uniref:hypothetical protein n=1 Tax=Burkholderia gladioli TaxID=28095 RepID=UPI00163DEB04|nr:hypothetical protein [Burkholderia gladioli]
MKSATKRFVMVCGDKGGTGKSLMTRVLADRIRREQRDALLIDVEQPPETPDTVTHLQ